MELNGLGLLFVVIYLVCLLILTTEWAKSGYFEMWLDRRNRRPKVALIAIPVCVFLSEILQKKFGWQITGLDNPRVAVFLIGTAIVWFFIYRKAISPSGYIDYNRALLRTNFWSRSHFFPSQILKEDGKNLRNFARAQKTIEYFITAICDQRQLADLHPEIKNYQINVATAQEGLAFLYRMMNEFDKARQELKKAEDLVENLLRGDSATKTNRLLSLKSQIIFRQAEINHALGEISEAKAGYNQYLSFGKQLGDQNYTKIVKQLLAKLN